MRLEKILSYDNIAEKLPESLLTEIGSKVKQGYEDDKGSRSSWETQNKDAMKCALQVSESKSTPWQGASNVKYPLMTISAMQFAARAYPAVVTGSNVAKCTITGYDEGGQKAARAQRLSMFMNWQLLEEMDGWEEEQDSLLHVLPISGCCYKKVYWKNGKPVSEMVLPTDLVVDYYTKDLESSTRVSHIIRYSKNEVVTKQRSGEFLDIEMGEPVAVYDKDEVREFKPAGEDPPYRLIEQHTWWDLDEDGYSEPYIITIQEDTGKLLRMERRFDVDSIIFNDKEKVQEIIPEKYFVKYSFIPAPDRNFYDLGFGSLLYPLNEAVNTSINQLIDAGTLSNMGGGFVGRGVRMRSGALRFKLGEWTPVDSTGDDLRKGLVPLPVREPSSVLFQLMGMLISSGEKLSSITDPMVGESPGSHVPATTTLAMIEQGSKVFGGITKRIHRSLKEELQLIFRLNKLYQDETKYFNVVDPMQEMQTAPQDGQPMQQGMGQMPPQSPSQGQMMAPGGQNEQQMIGRNDFQGDNTDVRPYSDPSLTSDVMRMKQAEALMAIVDRPETNSGEIIKRYVDALQISSSEKILQPPPPQPDPALMIETAKLELDQKKLELKEKELELKDREKSALILESKVRSITQLADRELEVPDEEYNEAVGKYAAIKEETKNEKGVAVTPGNGQPVEGDQGQYPGQV